MKPPYNITTSILNLILSISEKLGEIRSAKLIRPPTELRKKNRIKTIQSSLGIEGNTLSVEQITDLLNNKRVLAPAKDIMEVRNAIEVYSMLDDFNAYDLKSLCAAHDVLMKGLIKDAGKLRHESVGIFNGKGIAHLAPPGDRVYPLMKELFVYLQRDKDPLLIKSCVFHYELEFIHPFSDGNGRMGRLWQTMLLKEYSPVFEYLPIESLIKDSQQEYYDVLDKSDKQGNSTSFIEFMLHIANMALDDLLRFQNVSYGNKDRILLFKDIIKGDYFTRKNYLRYNKEISAATASRDLRDAVLEGLLEKTGDKRLTQYRFK